MTVKELIKELQKYPESQKIYSWDVIDGHYSPDVFICKRRENKKEVLTIGNKAVAKECWF